MFGLFGTLALFFASFVTQRILSKGGAESIDQEFDKDSLPLAKEGTHVPVVFGRVRVNAPNIIFSGFDSPELFIRHPLHRGGGGFGGGLGEIVAYEYGGDVTFAASAMPFNGTLVSKLHRVWLNQKLAFDATIDSVEPLSSSNPTAVLSKDVPTPKGLSNDSSDETYGEFFGGKFFGGGIGTGLANRAGTIRYFPGDFGQARSQRLMEWAEDVGESQDIPAYRGQALVAFEGFVFGESPTLPNVAFEMESIPSHVITPTVGGATGPDANPAAALWAVLTDPWIGLGIDVSKVDSTSFDSAAVTLDAESHGFSMVVSRETEAREIVRVILDQIDGILYEDFSDGLIKLKLVREDYTVSSLPLFDESNIIDVEEWKTQTWNDVYNRVRVMFQDRTNHYIDRPAVADDPANRTIKGRYKTASFDLPGVKNGSLANKIAYRKLKALSTPNVAVRLKVTRDAVTLSPGDVVKVTLSKHNITEMVFRVTSFDHGTIDDNAIILEAVRDKFDTSLSPYADPPPPWVMGTIEPGQIADWTVYEADWFTTNQATLDRLTSDPEDSHLVYMASAPSSQEIGYTPEASTDGGASFVEDMSLARSLAQPIQFTASAKVSRDYAREEEPYDTSTGLLIRGLSDSSVLKTATAAEIRDGKNRILVGGADGEFMAYESFTDHGSGRYTLNNVWRGLRDTGPADHLDGELVQFVGVSGNDVLGNRRYNGDEIADVRLSSSTGIRRQNRVNAAAAQRTLKKRPKLPLPVADLLLESVPSQLKPNVVKEYKGADPLETIYQAEIDLVWKNRLRTKETISRGNDADESIEADVNYRIDVRMEHDDTWDEGADQGTLNGTTSFREALERVPHGPHRVRVMPTRDLGDGAGARDAHQAAEIAFDASPNRNLLKNPGFEDGGDHWTVLNGSASFNSDSFGIQGGASSGYVVGSGASNYDVIQDVDVSVLDVVGKDALVVVYARNANSDADDTIDVTVKALDEGGFAHKTQNLGATTPGTGEWTRHEVQLTDLPEETEQVRVQLGGQIVDDVGAPDSAFDQCSLRVGIPSTQQLTNESFEAGDLTGWTAEAGTWSVTTGEYAGTNAVTATADGSELSQTASIPSGNKPGDVAHLSWAFQGTQTAMTDTAQVILEALDSLGAVLSSVQTDPETGTTEDVYEERELFLEIPEGATDLKVRLLAEDVDGSGNPGVGFDDFSLRIWNERVRYPARLASYDHAAKLAEWGDGVEPTHLWRLDENLGATDLAGTEDLEQSDGTAQPTQGAHNSDLDSVVMAVLSDGSGEHLETAGTSALDVGGATSIALLFEGEIDSLPASGNRALLGKFSSTIGYEIQITDAGLLRFVAIDESFTSQSPSAPTAVQAGDVVRCLAVLDRANNVFALYSSTHGSVSEAVSVGNLSNSEKFTLGKNASNNAPAHKQSMVAAWVGTAAEGRDYTTLRNIELAQGWIEEAEELLAADWDTPTTQQFPDTASGLSNLMGI